MNNWFEAWFTGFVDGEGTFHIEISSMKKNRFGVSVSPAFRITLHKKDRSTLEKIKNFLGLGSIVKHQKNSLQYTVSSINDCLKIADIFTRNNLLTKKSEDFNLWKKCLLKIKNKEHLTTEGIIKIAKLRDQMSSRGKKKWTADKVEKFIKRKEKAGMINFSLMIYDKHNKRIKDNGFKTEFKNYGIAVKFIKFYRKLHPQYSFKLITGRNGKTINI